MSAAEPLPPRDRLRLVSRVRRRLRIGSLAIPRADVLRGWIEHTGEWARRRPRAALAVAVLLGAVGVAAWWLRPVDLPGVPLRRVEEGPFKVTVVEGGTLQALKSVTYGSSIQSNQAKIVAMAPEGKLVQKGDLLLLFDAAPFEEEIRKSDAALGQARAELLKAQQEARIQTIANSEELAAARQRLTKSELELKDVKQGKGRLREEEARAAVANAERDVAKAQTAYDDLKPMLDEGFITRQELERAEQAVQRAQEDLALAKRRRDALLEYGRPLELSQAESDASLSKESLRQLEQAAGARLQQRQAAVAAAEARIREASAQLELARQQLARTEVRADVPGIVVYRDVFFGSEARKPQVGDQVWANQPLLILPDISRMVVETKVRETDVYKVSPGQKAAVTVDAYPGLRLAGHITLVGTLAQEERERKGAKFFGVTVQIDQGDGRLRPGMTARVEIQVEERPRALFVPLDAVFLRDGVPVAWVAERSGVHQRRLVLGPSNANFVVVESGLSRGERVLLKDPEAPAADPAGPPAR